MSEDRQRYKESIDIGPGTGGDSGAGHDSGRSKTNLGNHSKKRDKSRRVRSHQPK